MILGEYLFGQGFETLRLHNMSIIADKVFTQSLELNGAVFGFDSKITDQEERLHISKRKDHKSF